jgi:hypothetical protein
VIASTEVLPGGLVIDSRTESSRPSSTIAADDGHHL